MSGSTSANVQSSVNYRYRNLARRARFRNVDQVDNQFGWQSPQRRSRSGRCAPPIGPMLEAERRNYGSAGAVGRDRLESPREAVAGAVADVDENDLRAVGRPVAVERLLVPKAVVLARASQAVVVGQIDKVRPIGIGKHHMLDVAGRCRSRPEDKPRSIG